MSTSDFSIPSDNDKLEKDILARKAKYMDRVYSVFKKIFNDDVLSDKINVFTFENTNLEVIIKKQAYLSNLENLLDYYIKEEEYEKCNFIKNIITKYNLSNIDPTE